MLFFLLRVVLAIQGLLFLNVNFRMFSSRSVKKLLGILIGIALNLYITLGRMVIFTILSLPIHEQGRFFHLLVSSLISFLKGLNFSL